MGDGDGKGFVIERIRIITVIINSLELVVNQTFEDLRH
jgi:hypothetical protein